MTFNHTVFPKIVIVLILMIFAGYIRFVYIANTEFIMPIRADAYYYVTYANNIIDYGVFSKDDVNIPPHSDSFWAPGYPLFLAFSIMSSNYLDTEFYSTALILQVLIGALIVGLTIFLGAQVLKFSWSCFAGLLVAISPHMISLGSYLLTETLFSFVLLLSLCVFCMAVKKNIKIVFLISALLFGISYLVNPVVFFLPLLLWLWIFVQSKYPISNNKSVMLLFLLLYIGIALAWAVRNEVYVVENAADSSSRLLTNLIIGSHSDYYEVWRNDPRDPENPASIDEDNFNGSYSLFSKTMMARILDRPGHYARWYLVNKPVLLWNWKIMTGQGDIYVYPVIYSLYHKSKLAIVSYSISKSMHYWLVAFAMFSIPLIYFLNKERNELITISLYICLLYISIVYIVTQSEARYSIPIRPEMYLCATLFLATFVNHVKEKYSKQA